jgi:lipoprotein-anchoring transpeptidase ErfK/SrfK
VLRETWDGFGRWAVTLIAAGLFGCASGPDRARMGDTGSLDAGGSETLGDSAAEDGPDDALLAQAERAAEIERARRAYDAGLWDGGDLYAAAMRTSVMSIPAWPDDPDAGEGPPPATTRRGPRDGTSAAGGRRGHDLEAADSGAYRLGYIRHGSHVAFFPTPLPNEQCPEGWYELLEGGFVCGKYASPDPRAPSVKFAANPPNLAGPTPYKYGYAVVDNTPVYRRVLSVHDRQKYEPELLPPPPDAGATADAGAGVISDETDTSDEPAPDRDKHTVREPKDAGLVKLGDLKGRGVLVRRMMKGFYVALDRAFNAAHARWWRTSEGFAIPYEKIALQSWTPDFHGSWVKVAMAVTPDGGGADGGGDGDAGGDENRGVAPAGNGTAALVNSGYAARFVLNDKGKMAFTTPIPKWTAVELAEEPKTIDGVVFHYTTSGFWVRHADLMIATPEPPSDLAEDEKWIDVDLGRQFLVAFEGAHPVYATRVSSGRRYPWDPTHDHPTPTGTYRIYEKHVSTTMDGDVASDGPYSIEDVPWVMYFLGSYALHGAFWHNLFGSTRSHGCINLSPLDARELFFWVEPTLPKGWHGVFQTSGHPGTRVVIHEPVAAHGKSVSRPVSRAGGG